MSTSALLKEVSSELGYGENPDAETKSRLTGYIKDGEYRLKRIAGASLDITKDRLAHSLLIDYCRYANAQATEHFEENFKRDLNTLYHDYAIKEFEENAET